VRELDRQENAIIGSISNSSYNSGDFSNYNKEKPEGDRTINMAINRATKGRQISVNSR
jgi:hypothetical protein